MEDLTGKQLGPYRVVAPLGEGGMAAVYRAYQPGMDRFVAIKILPRHLASDPTFVGRFGQEAKLIAKLQHPHILPVFDFGQAEGYTYIVMPLVEAGTLTMTLQGQPLPLDRIRIIVSQIGDALDYAHAHGLVHRDVKPSNVLLDERGNCLLTDFGIAKMVEGTSKFTATGGLIGTPAYMSPEQGAGETVDRRSDIYSLGVMLYEMATGRTPFNAETPVAIVIKHINDPLPPPRRLNPTLPESLERVILRALAKHPDDRFQTAADMVGALQAALPAGGHVSVAPAPSTTEIAPTPSRAECVSAASPFAPVTATREAARPVPPAASGGRRVPVWIWAFGGLFVMCIAVGLIAFVGSRLFAVAPQGQADAETATASAQVVVPPTSIAMASASAPGETPEPQPTTVSDTPTPSPTQTLPPSPEPTTTPIPTPTPTPIPTSTSTPTQVCPAVTGTFAGVWPALRDRLGCATGPDHSTAAAEELFQNGWMYWREDDDRIYVIFSTGRWESHADVWFEGDPEFSCPDPSTPDESPPTPKRGFGKIWCTVPGVRQGLGAATEGERAVGVAVQSFDHGLILLTDRWTWVFYSDGSWERR